jgi:hypothetical protein
VADGATFNINRKRKLVGTVCDDCHARRYRMPQSAGLPCPVCSGNMTLVTSSDRASAWRVVLDDGTQQTITLRKLQAMARANGIVWTCVYARIRNGHRSLTRLMSPSKKTGRPINLNGADTLRNLIRLLIVNRGMTIIAAAKALGVSEQTMRYKLTEPARLRRSLSINPVDVETMVREWNLSEAEARKLRLMGAREAGWKV